MELLTLFITFFKIGMVSIGGGIASISIIANHVVNLQGWLTANEFSHLITIAEMTPGPISINAATFVGFQVAGPLGSLIATLGNIMPSIILISILSLLYTRYQKHPSFIGFLNGLRPLITAFILITCISITQTAYQQMTSALMTSLNTLLLCSGVFILQKYKCSPLLVMFICGLCSSLLYFIR